MQKIIIKTIIRSESENDLSNQNNTKRDYYLNENKLNVFEQNINLKDFLRSKKIFQKDLRSRSTNSLTSSQKENLHTKSTATEISQFNETKKCTMLTTVEFFPNEQNVITEFDVANEEYEREKLKEDVKKLIAYEKLLNKSRQEIRNLDIEEILVKDYSSYKDKLRKATVTTNTALKKPSIRISSTKVEKPKYEYKKFTTPTTKNKEQNLTEKVTLKKFFLLNYFAIVNKRKCKIICCFYANV